LQPYRLSNLRSGPDPLANGDFDVLISSDRIKELDPGHQCLGIADPPSGTAVGSNATLQIKYTSEFNTDRNETYYAWWVLNQPYLT
jgi:hypothetical protein